MPRIVDRTARRAELAAVAAAVFGEKGVANTSVSDIVKAAGVAQGTFYLYFASKDEIILAVVELMADGMVTAIEGSLNVPGSSAVERLYALRDVLSGFENDPSAMELADFIHRPENRALHDRLTEHFAPALAPLVESIVAQGVAEGVFQVPDVRAAAWFVMGGLQSAELAGTPAAEMPAAIDAATTLALRALGYEESR
ncbi:MAG: TetR/AcrR family transcriptional regulator [Actinobacteria bacterium]|nr:TetR/AcrR family transcriptional regulator [Actinomycetota bacterium]MCG2808633.1 TetR/AcrR family transcriptional regulator [Coriobacteriia bacterium]